MCRSVWTTSENPLQRACGVAFVYRAIRTRSSQAAFETFGWWFTSSTNSCATAFAFAIAAAVPVPVVVVVPDGPDVAPDVGPEVGPEAPDGPDVAALDPDTPVGSD